MKQIQPYLTFRGNCQEAMNFYSNCFNADIINKQTYENATTDIPENYRSKLQHAEVKGKGVHFMAYDAAPDTPLNSGNQIQMAINTTSEDEFDTLFEKLSHQGKVNTTPRETDWNAKYANCTDKFGVHWMLNYQHN